jgi:hypothetical protein
MIDWKSLQPLPLRRHRDTDGRERLAKQSFLRKTAKHKGRCHTYAWQDREEERKRKLNEAKTNEAKSNTIKEYKKQVREYWQGLRDTHPIKPS